MHLDLWLIHGAGCQVLNAALHCAGHPMVRYAAPRNPFTFLPR